MSPQSPPSQEPFDVIGDLCTRLLMFGVRTMAVTVEVVVRKDFGAEYLNTQAAVALLLIPFWGVLVAPEYDPRPIWLYALLYLGLCVRHRLSVIRRRWRGEQGHRFYNGVPRLRRYFPRLSEVTVKKWIEPLVVFGIGMLLLPFSPPLGMFVLIGAGCSLLLMFDWDMRMQRRAREMHDAMIEQEVIAERFRELRGDRYR